MKDRKVTYLVQAAMIGAIYVVLTLVFSAFSFGQIQVRISEGLTILPYFTPAAIPGLFVGCLIANTIAGAAVPDIIFGSLATLAGAYFSWRLRRNRWLVPIPPIIANSIVVPFVLRYAYGVNLPIPFMMLTVGVGEVISCGAIGEIFLTALGRHASAIFRNPDPARS